ncbi:13373_t:CDS:10 [Acaulospora colombiana]|uniref:13373_t:CDS:1 n=1 Tax=Acaulospora colombiana TaxID=27376 RepID=A0ACA9MDL5_9GLOM|nr:13373_t:CDS:10 [Acaulospora colombiana]
MVIHTSTPVDKLHHEDRDIKPVIRRTVLDHGSKHHSISGVSVKGEYGPNDGMRGSDSGSLWVYNPLQPVKSRKSQAYEPLLLENEREAVADLLQYLENRTTTNFFTGSPLSALTTLSFSDNIDLQRSAALAFAEITEKEVRQVGRDTLDPLLFLLSSHDTDVQRAASAALVENKLLIVKLGGLEPLIRQMLSPNIEVQCNAVDENKSKIARSGALVPLTRLARSKDMRVQRNATGALLNMTHSDENRIQLVNAGAVPVLVNLLTSPDTDVQYYCTTALSNIAVDAQNRRKLAATEPKLVQSLVVLMDSPSLKVQCQAALALRNLASDDKYQIDIVKAGGLTPLLRLLCSTYLPLILSAAACVRNVSIHPSNESPIIEAGFLNPLVELLSFEENEEVQCHAISTLRNLAASSERNKMQIVQAGAVQKIKDLVMQVPMNVQSEMTACVAVLALSEELKPQLLEMGICDVLIPLTNSPSIEVQGNSAAALGNLTSKDTHVSEEDYTAFNDVWDKPEGGMHAYLHRFLTSSDLTFQHIAVWTIVQLLESRELAVSQPSSPNTYSRTQSDSMSEDAEGTGQEEITLLAKKIMHYVNGELDAEMSPQGDGPYVGSVRSGRNMDHRTQTHRAAESAASSVSRRITGQLPREDDEAMKPDPFVSPLVCRCHFFGPVTIGIGYLKVDLPLASKSADLSMFNCQLSILASIPEVFYINECYVSMFSILSHAIYSDSTLPWENAKGV